MELARATRSHERSSGLKNTPSSCTEDHQWRVRLRYMTALSQPTAVLPVPPNPSCGHGIDLGGCDPAVRAAVPTQPPTPSSQPHFLSPSPSLRMREFEGLPSLSLAPTLGPSSLPPPPIYRLPGLWQAPVLCCVGAKGGLREEVLPHSGVHGPWRPPPGLRRREQGTGSERQAAGPSHWPAQRWLALHDVRRLWEGAGRSACPRRPGTER